MLPIDQLRGKVDWQQAASELCRGQRSIDSLREALFSASPQQRRQQRAGYLLLHVHRQCPVTLDPLLPQLLRLVEAVPPVRTHESIARQVFSVFQDRPIPEALAGQLFSSGVRVFLEPASAVAARARGLDAAANVARQYDGLWVELAEIVAGLSPAESPGIQSIARRVGQEAERNITRA